MSQPGYVTTYRAGDGTGPRLLQHRHIHTTNPEPGDTMARDITADDVQDDLDPAEVAAFLTAAQNKLSTGVTPDAVTDLRQRMARLTAQLDTDTEDAEDTEDTGTKG